MMARQITVNVNGGCIAVSVTYTNIEQVSRTMCHTSTKLQCPCSNDRLGSMEVKVLVDGLPRVVCGVTEETTCQDVVIALAQALGMYIRGSAY